MTRDTFLLLMLAVSFFNVGTLWSRTTRSWVFIPLGAAFVGSLAAVLYHPLEWPIWPAFAGAACQVAVLVVTAVSWRRRPTTSSAVLATAYAIVLLGWIVVGTDHTSPVFAGPVIQSRVAPQKTFELSGRVTGGTRNHVVYISLWQANGFLTQPSQVVRIEPGKQPVFRFDVEGGRWTISAFEDSNGNGVLDMGTFGPTEPGGFWRDFTEWHKPKFDDVASIVDRDTTTADIQLR